jgi:hypothetical protein
VSFAHGRVVCISDKLLKFYRRRKRLPAENELCLHGRSLRCLGNLLRLPTAPAPMKNHRLIDERSLAFDRLIAEKLRRDPTLVEKARANISRWLQTTEPRSAADLLEWQRLLDQPLPELLALLESTDEHATRLRQSSPFCGILTPAERLAIIREFYARESVAA